MHPRHPSLVLVTLATWFSTAAHAQVRLLVSDAQNRNLYQVNTANAATTLIGSFGLPAGTNVAGLAWDDASSTLFGSTTGIGTNALYRINTTTGAATPVVALGSETLMHGLAAGPGGLFGASTSTLYRINAATGAPTSVGSLIATSQMHGLDFNNTGQLFGCTGVVEGGLYTINTTNGAATFLAPTARLNSIAFHPITGELFGVANPGLGGSSSSLYSINPATGASTLIGTLPNVGNALALEFVIPAPASTVTIAVAAALYGLRRRR